MYKIAKKNTKTEALSRLSDIAKYLEEAGFAENAKCVHDAMCAIDGSMEGEDLLDDNIRTDEQYNTGGSIGYSGEAGSASPSLFSIPEAEKLASLANKMDQKGLYDEASEIDELLKELEEELFEDDEDEEDENMDALVGANGKGNVGVTDAGGFAGLSDSYFYRSYDNLEGAYGPSDR